MPQFLVLDGLSPIRTLRGFGVTSGLPVIRPELREQNLEQRRLTNQVLGEPDMRARRAGSLRGVISFHA
jgi:hypothetical protein